MAKPAKPPRTEREIIAFSEFERETIDGAEVHWGPSNFQGPPDWLIGEPVLNGGKERIVKAIHRVPPASGIIQSGERIGIVFE